MATLRKTLNAEKAATKAEAAKKYRFYTLTDLVPILGLSHTTLRILAKAGKLKAVMMLGKWRVSQAALDDFVTRVNAGEVIDIASALADAKRANATDEPEQITVDAAIASSEPEAAKDEPEANVAESTDDAAESVTDAAKSTGEFNEEQYLEFIQKKQARRRRVKDDADAAEKKRRKKAPDASIDAEQPGADAAIATDEPSDAVNATNEPSDVAVATDDAEKTSAEPVISTDDASVVKEA